MLSFAAPLALFGLLGLPLIYWLLRVTPPHPREIVFPPTKILRELKPDEETPAKTPWWLMALRLMLAAALIFAMAGPVWAPSGVVASSAPTLIVIDDGWPAAPTWDRRIEGAASIIESAGRVGGPVAVALASETAAPVLGDGPRALEKLRSVRPKPFLPDRKAIGDQVLAFARAHPTARIVWISDGLAQGDAAGFARALKESGASGIEVYVEDHAPRALAAPTNDAAALSVDVLRTGDNASAIIDALDAKGRTIGRTTTDFNGAPRVRAKIELPVELRNEVSHLRIEGENSAGAVALLDARSKVKRVALVGGEGADLAQPLLFPLYYLEKALAPFAQVRTARPGVVDPVQALLAENPNILALADVGLSPGESFDALSRFVEEGGTLVRFAGPRLANADDDLLPVRLRRNGRVLGGAMSWEEPKSLAEFDAASPFFGLPASKDVTVQRQVLAEPDPGLADKTWARLSDGTPLVTAARRGKGLIVLFHVNADANWSNLPISGLFVEMLKRISAMAGESAPSGGERSDAFAEQSALAPMRVLDGFGALGAPGPTAQSIPQGFDGPASAEHPPGLYGTGEAFVAVQTLRSTDEISAFDFAGAGLSASVLRSGAQLDLRGPLLVFALAAFIADALIAMALGGKLRLRPFGAATAALLAILFVVAASNETRAEPTQKSAATQRDKDAALTTRLAYVMSGDSRVDEISRLGLEALSQALNSRTSFSPGDPVGVDPAKDELAFYPMLYWPIVASAPQPTANTVARVAAYMKQGGTVVFDTRDALSQRIGGAPTPETRWLRDLTKGLDIPPLEVTPRDHVITKTFYLLDGFVGRYANGETWVEALPPEPKDQAARPVRATDSVSAIVITSNDLAAAWAHDKRGQPLFPLTPGGARQREFALRGGINLVMYTLTGNYKSDQVHVRDLLERLGQ